MKAHVLLAAGAAILASTGNATAADTSNVGRDIAVNCTTCHGNRGAIPSIAGQDKAYLVQQLKDFRDGKRPSTVMQQLAKGYSDAQIEAAAAYLASQKAN